MSQQSAFKSFFAVAVLLFGACDGLDEEQSREFDVQDAGLVAIASDEIEARPIMPAPRYEADADDPSPRFLGELDPGTALAVIPLDAPEELEIEEDNWSEFDLSDGGQPVASPPGKTCCVNCADGWSGWWNRGTGDECNKRGANWCHDHNWNFINAEWFTNCPAG